MPTKAPLFQHRHYAAIAKLWSGQLIVTHDDLADFFAKDNPAFNRERFIAACKLYPTNKRDER